MQDKRRWHHTEKGKRDKANGDEPAVAPLMRNTFPTRWAEILERMQGVQPEAYARSRNFVDGKVTRLSPYLSRGAISTKDVIDSLLARGLSWNQVEKLVQELGWREYFQRVWQHLGKGIDEDIRHPQPNVRHHGMPLAIQQGETGIEGIDQGIESLLKAGYMHNHQRMYTAALACNIAHAHWKQSARWMYYHLLDGDWASNALSWQWVAGSFSNKTYVANQENINRYTGTFQRGTFLDMDYESLSDLSIPDVLRPHGIPALDTQLALTPLPLINPEWPVLVYTYYNLDPRWHSDEKANRILLLEPSHFQAYPVSRRCLKFAAELGRNIADLQVFCGEFSELQAVAGAAPIHFKEHPMNRHFMGTEEARDWMCVEVGGYSPSFSGWWKQAEPKLRALFRG
jgi:deoxyribodipyrimidine photo-lyase